MVYGMLERHGGEIQIESERGKGTSIRLIFPPALVTAPTSGATGVLPPLRPPQPLRILFVDDDPIMLKSLRDTLEQDGHVVVVADGGQRGIEAFRSACERGERFAAVITDLGMPHVDGRTVAIAVKTAAPDVPVILLTGWGHRLLAQNDRPPSVDRVLSKPPKAGGASTRARRADHGVTIMNPSPLARTGNGTAPSPPQRGTQTRLLAGWSVFTECLA